MLVLIDLFDYACYFIPVAKCGIVQFGGDGISHRMDVGDFT